MKAVIFHHLFADFIEKHQRFLGKGYCHDFFPRIAENILFDLNLNKAFDFIPALSHSISNIRFRENLKKNLQIKLRVERQLFFLSFGSDFEHTLQ